jgi:ubiquinone/menaquinone biosynthesis C-methylase UbiE
VKQRILRCISAIGALGVADQGNYYCHRLISAPANIRFRRHHPDFALPPPRLAFESYGHTSWPEYAHMGRAHADMIIALVQERLGNVPVRVLEWGCGAGRILRHMAQQHSWTAWGVDVDPEAVQWCQQHLPQTEPRVSGFLPPLPFEDASLDAVYHYSVWTHMSREAISAWIREFSRVLRPGGVMVATTHGDSYLPMLMPYERARYLRGEVVSRREVSEGRKYYLSFHPAADMERMLGEYFTNIEHRPASPGDLIPQDIWLVSR